MFDHIKQDDFIVLANTNIKIENVTLSKSCVTTDGRIFGNVVAKALTFEVSTSEVVEGSEFDYFAVLVDSDGVGEAYNQGRFIVQYIENGATTDLKRVTAFDIMLKTNIAYTTALNYAGGAVTLADVIAEICTNTGIALKAGQTIVNSTFVVDSNQFLDGQTCRDVLVDIAEISGTFAHIVDDELVFTRPDITATAVAEIQTVNYGKADLQTATVAIDAVTLLDTRTGFYATANGGTTANTLTIEDNHFAYTQAARDALITDLFAALEDFTYVPFMATGIGDPQLQCGDPVVVYDSAGTEYASFMLSMEYKSMKEGSVQLSTVSALAIPAATVAYEYQTTKTDKLATSAAHTVAYTTRNMTITVGGGKDFATIQEAINSLPMFINHDVLIDVYSGTYAEDVVIEGLQGTGTLTIDEHAGETATTSSLLINGCSSISILWDGINIVTTATNAALVTNSQNIEIKNTSATGSAATFTGLKTSNAFVYANSCTFSSKGSGIHAESGSVVRVYNCDGISNTVGVICDGSIIIGGTGNTITGTTPKSVTSGGLILWSLGIGTTEIYGDTVIKGAIEAGATQRPASAMTSNTAPSPYVASASSEYSSSYQAWRAFNKTYSDDNSWASTAADSARWLQIKLDKALRYITVTVANRTRGSIVNGLVAFTINGSNNGTDFTELLSVTGRDGSTSAAVTTHVCNNSTAYQYIRLNISNPGSGATYACVGEMYIDGIGQIYA